MSRKQDDFAVETMSKRRKGFQFWAHQEIEWVNPMGNAA